MDAVRQRITLPLLGALLAGACIGVGGGAATYAALSSGNTKTVVHQVTVPESQPAANTTGLSVHSIYELARKGVVKITVVVTVGTAACQLRYANVAQCSGITAPSSRYFGTFAGSPDRRRIN